MCVKKGSGSRCGQENIYRTVRSAAADGEAWTESGWSAEGGFDRLSPDQMGVNAPYGKYQ